MNLLIDLVPETVTIDNEEYEINSDFRTSILFELLMQDKLLNDKEKIVNALSLYYSDITYKTVLFSLNKFLRQRNPVEILYLS